MFVIPMSTGYVGSRECIQSRIIGDVQFDFQRCKRCDAENDPRNVSGDDHGVNPCGTLSRPKLESGVRAVKPTSPTKAKAKAKRCSVCLLVAKDIILSC